MSSTYGIPREPALLSILDPGPANARASYTWSDIVPLLPRAGTEPGSVWAVEVEPLLVFLRQLHPSATGELHVYVYQVPLAQLPPTVTLLQSRGGDFDVAQLRAQGVESVKVVNPQAPMGCFATLLRADSTLDVLLRVHAEFELAPDRVLFTPAQFEARLVVDPTAKRVVSFSLSVPDRDTNVDINVMDENRGGDRTGRADIGYVPRLALETRAAPPELPATKLAAARARLARSFYPFASIEWKPLSEAWERARATKRPLHVVQLFGTLDDESC